MRIESKIVCTLIAYTFVLLFLVSSTASAGLGVSGAIIERKVDPGETFTHEMTISSDTASPPMDLAVDILGMNQTSDGEYTELNDSDDIGPYSARTFLKASPESFHLDPGESQKVAIEGKIPFDSHPGGRYALVNIHSLPIGKGTVGIIVAVEVPVRLTITGIGLKKAGRIEDLRLEKPVSPRMQNISLVLRNTGNCHYKARAQVAVSDIRGNAIANVSTPLSENIIPGASRIFWISTTSKKDLNRGDYLAKAAVKLDNGSTLDTMEARFEV